MAGSSCLHIAFTCSHRLLGFVMRLVDDDCYIRGRGRGGGSFDPPKPFVIFPEIALPDPKSISKDSQLVSSYFNFQKFWRNSPYHLGDGVLKKENESLDIERFSDALKPKTKLNKSGYFYDYLVLRPDNFPKELLGDVQRDRPAKRAKWSMDADLKKLELFEKLEAKLENQDFDDDDDDYNEPASDGDCK
ncbi:unnamed protein product [Arabis nemorensis]|uniref:Uncharacterized protein n=1 Tax=Arabis nemorensis TaxID=586526 RepID=A0A565BDP5_9BRAS|nr:unnamed protein product [Arabis nemorensis]